MISLTFLQREACTYPVSNNVQYLSFKGHTPPSHSPPLSLLSRPSGSGPCLTSVLVVRSYEAQNVLMSHEGCPVDIHLPRPALLVMGSEYLHCNVVSPETTSVHLESNQSQHLNSTL